MIFFRSLRKNKNKNENKAELNIEFDSSEALSKADFKKLELCLSLGLCVEYLNKSIISAAGGRILLQDKGIISSRRIKKDRITVTASRITEQILLAGTRIQLNKVGLTIYANLAFQEIILCKKGKILATHPMDKNFSQNIIDELFKILLK